MTTEQLLQQLREKDVLLPQDILKDTNVSDLTNDIIEIFETYRTELEEDSKLRKNYTELVNYVYLMTLRKRPDQRKKDLFNNTLTTFLIDTPLTA